MAAVLAAAGAFVYLRVQDDLDEAVDEALAARADEVAAAGEDQRRSGSLPEPVEDPEERFTQLLAPGGRVLAAAGGARTGVLAPSELRGAAAGEVLLDRRVPGIEGTARVLAQPLTAGRGSAVVAVGQSLDDRDETLSGLVASFAVGGPVAVLLASAIGYLLAATGLRPVEAMRRRATRISLEDDGKRLPLPAARDEVRRLGETLNEMLDRLRRSFERERRFVADASHELRTPVAVVKTEIEGALRSGDYGPQVREALVAARDECDSLAQLAEDLLVIARAAEGRLPVRPEPLRARPLIESVRERFADRAAQHGRRIRVDVAGVSVVRADPLRIRQALGNLVDNALRHGGGEVAVRAARAGSGVSLEVSDQGPGFDPDIAEQAFERFTRGDSARTRGGSGLGLAIVRAVAEAHGGGSEIVGGRRVLVRIWLPDGPISPAAGGRTA